MARHYTTRCWNTTAATLHLACGYCRHFSPQAGHDGLQALQAPAGSVCPTTVAGISLAAWG
jgi:hypothetical protein